MNSQIIQRAKRIASKSLCRYKVGAIGFNHKGEIISSSFNKPRFCREGGSVHAEMHVMKISPPSLKSILICRVGLSGNLRPIHPCKTCQQKADELGIKILTIEII